MWNRKANSPRRSRQLWHRLGVETLEDRRMLSVASPTLELFSTSPALFVENQGQWADESVRFLHQGGAFSGNRHTLGDCGESAYKNEKGLQR